MQERDHDDSTTCSHATVRRVQVEHDVDSRWTSHTRRLKVARLVSCCSYNHHVYMCVCACASGRSRPVCTSSLKLLCAPTRPKLSHSRCRAGGAFFTCRNSRAEPFLFDGPNVGKGTWVKGNPVSPMAGSLTWPRILTVFIVTSLTFTLPLLHSRTCSSAASWLEIRACGCSRRTTTHAFSCYMCYGIARRKV